MQKSKQTEQEKWFDKRFNQMSEQQIIINKNLAFIHKNVIELQDRAFRIHETQIDIIDAVEEPARNRRRKKVAFTKYIKSIHFGRTITIVAVVAMAVKYILS